MQILSILGQYLHISKPIRPTVRFGSGSWTPSWTACPCQIS